MPEFGLPEKVQNALLSSIWRTSLEKLPEDQAWDWLMIYDPGPDLKDRPRRGERHQCVMNALYAAWDESHEGKEPTDEEGDELLQQAARLYPDAPWYQFRKRFSPPSGK